MKRVLLACAMVGLLSFASRADADPYDTQGISVSDDDGGSHAAAPIGVLIAVAIGAYFLYQIGGAVERSNKNVKGK